jgi:MGT family glycosyltransferase
MTLAVARTLRERGHTVSVMTAERKKEMIEKAGMIYLKPARWSASIAGAMGSSEKSSLASTIADLNRVAHTIFFPHARELMEDLADATATLKPDMIIGSQVTFGVPAFAQSRGLPWATHCILATYPLPSDHLFPWGLGKGEPASALDRVVAAVMRAAGVLIMRPLVREWSRTLSALGISHPPAGTLLEFTLSPYSYTVPSPPGFDLPRPDLPPQVQYVGACLWHETGATADWESPFTDDKPLIYCSAGTLVPRVGYSFYRKAIDAVVGEPVNMLAVIGRGIDPAQYGTPPANVVLRDYVPQNPVMRKAAAMIFHGGGATLTSALAQGIPVIVIPFGSDQPENAQRVERLGVGIHLDRNKCTADDVRNALRRVLNEPSYRRNAEAYAKVLAAHDGGVNGANALEAALAKAQSALVA